MVGTLLKAVALAALVGVCRAISFGFLLPAGSLQRDLYSVLGAFLPDPRDVAVAMGVHQAFVALGAVVVTLLVGRFIGQYHRRGAPDRSLRYATIHTIAVCAAVLALYIVGLGSGYTRSPAGFQQWEQYVDTVFRFGLYSMPVVYALLLHHFQRELAGHDGEAAVSAKSTPGSYRFAVWAVGLDSHGDRAVTADCAERAARDAAGRIVVPRSSGG